MKVKIWHFSDSHTYHDLLTIPEDIDIAIFSGDCSNPKNPYTNQYEVETFLKWFAKVPIRNKIMIAGNHDTSIEKRLITKEEIESWGIRYLENESVEIEGVKIWGSPHTPQFGDWAFMKHRSKLDKVWQSIPDDTDIVVVHGPAKGILDVSENRDYTIEQCGCSALNKRLLTLQPKLFCFGHIHNTRDIINAGIVKLSISDTIYSNGSVVTDGKFGKLTSNGNIIDLEL